MIKKLWNWLTSTPGVSSMSVQERNAFFCIRSSKWKKTRDTFLENNESCCAACGSTENLAVHHIVPVHINGDMELDENNLIVLCYNKTLNCHFFFGHLLNWTKSNPDVVKDAKIWREKLA